MRLAPEDIVYQGLPYQLDTLREGLLKAKDAKPRLSWSALAIGISDWWHDHAPEQEAAPLDFIKTNTLHDMAKGKSVPQWERARVVFAFLTLGPREFRCNAQFGFGGVLQTDAHYHAHAILESFGRRFAHNNGHLAALEGKYEAYRPSWRKNQFDCIIRSHVEFMRDGPAIWMVERQCFDCPNTGQPVEETDTGVVFFFSSAIVCLAQSKETDCMKLYSFSERQPDLSVDPKQGGEIISPKTVAGHVTAISMHGPHPSSPIYMIRKPNEGRRPLGHFHVSILDDDPNAEVLGAVSWLRESQTPLGLLPPAKSPGPDSKA